LTVSQWVSFVIPPKYVSGCIQSEFTADFGLGVFASAGSTVLATIAQAVTARRTSSAVVRQLMTLTRIACIPRQVVPLKKASPVSLMAVMTALVRQS
jgi:hypothetical protein